MRSRGRASRAATAGSCALGGGRVIDVAKAVAAALGGGARALAVPTTLSGAEMTRGHRHAAGVDETTPRVRCAVVVVDPALAASQPPAELAASALNALGHAVEGPCTVAANPVATLAGHEAARLLVGGVRRSRSPTATRSRSARSSPATRSTRAGFGLHHVLAQTLVREGLAGHGPANAIMLPHTIPALARRRPDAHAALRAVLGEEPAAAAARLCARTGATRLSALGISARRSTRAPRPPRGARSSTRRRRGRTAPSCGRSTPRRS